MKQIKLIFSESQLTALRERYFSELSDGTAQRDAAELASNTDAVREAVAQEFEARGYNTQAEEMRAGDMDVDEYVDALGTEPEISDVEIVATVLEDSVPELDLNI